MDCYEVIGNGWSNRKEVLAFSAGAEICVRRKVPGGVHGGPAGDKVMWLTHKPEEAVEGRDDVTTLHLLFPSDQREDREPLKLITGTANGDLRHIQLSEHAADEVFKAQFVTDGLPIRSSSVLQQPDHPQLLAASLNDTRVCVYPIDSTDTAIEPLSTIELRRPSNGHRTYRAWSTSFLSPSYLTVGLGPSEDPIHIHALIDSGLTKDPIRKFSLQNDLDKLEGEITLSVCSKKSTSSVYPVVPLPSSSSSAAANDGQVFLSGAYDGIIRLHDLRSSRHVEQAYSDPTDESAIYSLLPRGQEKLLAGTSRHALLKVFDMRLGAKAYSYVDATSPHASHTSGHSDWNLFLKPTTGAYPGRGGGNNWARRSAESSIYSLSSPSSASPHIYAGVEHAVVEMAITSVTDPHPDRAFFAREKGQKSVLRGWRDKEISSLAMYDQESGVQLRTQMDMKEMFRHKEKGWETASDAGYRFAEGLDERWKLASA